MRPSPVPTTAGDCQPGMQAQYREATGRSGEAKRTGGSVRSMGARSSTRDRNPGTAPARCDGPPVRELPGGQVLQAEQGQLETVLHPDLLEQAREVHLHRALRDHQRGGDLLVLEPLRQQADQLAFALRQRHPARAQEAVREGLLEPQFAGLHLLQAFHLQIRGQRFAQDPAHAQAHGLKRQLGRN